MVKRGKVRTKLASSLLPSDADLVYEEEILRDPYSLRSWWDYLQARRTATPERRFVLYERAVKALPGSYKLWHAYLQERILATRGRRLDDAKWGALNGTFERALVTMHKMPRMWIMYLKVLVEQNFLTQTRRAFDNALKALPVTQHYRIWPEYLEFVKQDAIPVSTALRVFRRYMKLEPTHAEEFINFLLKKEHWNEAAERLAAVLNDEAFVSIDGKSKHELWVELCDIITKHPGEVTGIPVEAILRTGIKTFTEGVGRLWTSLADYHIRKALFEKARDIFEEGMEAVNTVRDFSTIFDAYAQFEESLLTAKMEAVDTEAEKVDGDGEDFLLSDHADDIDLRLARLDFLIERRPELLSSVVLRQNPHNVHEWLKRVKLFAGQPMKQIVTFTQAVKTVSPKEAVGKVTLLWSAFAKFYEAHGDIPNARMVFEKATGYSFNTVDELASIWCEWAEMEMRNKYFKSALELMRRATVGPPAGFRGTRAEIPVQHRVYRSLRLWNLYVDLEESLGTLESTRAAYDRMLDLKIATPQSTLNYALLLREHNYFEDSFKVYERAVSRFKFPHVKDIWDAYLTQFVERFGGKKLERIRDLYEQALVAFPPEEAKPLYLQYAEVEEKYGLARHAMDIYDRARKNVAKSFRLGVFEVWIAKATEFYGITKTREIYEAAIEAGMGDKDTLIMCVKYANLERKLGEIDRARSLYIHGSQFANPKKERGFWSEWNEFEVKHGNEDTFREMLRIKRSVQDSFSQIYYAGLAGTGIVRAENNNDVDAAMEEGPDLNRSLDAMAALEKAADAEKGLQTAGLDGFVSAGVVEGNVAENPEEIDLDEEEEEAPKDMEIEEKPIPAAIYGKMQATQN